MYKKNFILSLSFVFVLGILIVSVINNTYAMPTNLLNDGKNGGMQFLGAGEEGEIPVYPTMDCTVTYTGCDDDTMQSRCNGVGGTLNGNICTWKMEDKSSNSCGLPIEVCNEEEPTPSPQGQCYKCKTESWIYHWSSSGTAPSSGSNGCSGGWDKSALTQLGCTSGTPPKEDQDDEPTYSKYCYTCTTEDNIFRRYEWEYNKPSDGTDNCTGWEIDRTVSQANCQNKSKQCYVCDNNYVWDYNKPSDGTENCTGWSLNSDLDKNNCKYVAPEPVPENSCYKCENDEKLFHWGLKPEPGSNNCSGNWNEETNINEEKNCKYVEPEIENPPTGNTLLYVFYVVELIALGYTGYCGYKILKIRKTIE